MCIVNIKVNDATIRRINPNLTDSEKIGQWLQHQVNTMLEEMVSYEEKHDKSVKGLYTAAETDDAQMSEEAFYARVKEAEEEYKRGEYFEMLPDESLEDFLKRVE